VTLGRSEQQILADVQLAVSRVEQWEREVRDALLRGAARPRTLDRIHRALGTQGIAYVVLGTASIEANRRHRRATTDRVDTVTLVTHLAQPT